MINKNTGRVDVLLGLQWGDEGKGKIVDLLSKDYKYVARFQGGPNSGHTIFYKGQKIVLHQIPSGIVRENTINIIGNGVVIDPFIIMKEIESIHALGIKTEGRLILSDKAHIITPIHKIQDIINEHLRENKIGTTMRGIGPVYTDKISRKGIRVKDLHEEFVSEFEEEYRAFLRNLDGYYYDLFKENDIDVNKLFDDFNDGVGFLFQNIDIKKTEFYINDILKSDNILAEGAQGTMLDIEFGTYPYVTSSNTTIGGVITGLGVSPDKIGKVFGITKAYSTRVGEGPFRTEILDDDTLCNKGSEVGSTTGRKRRCGWIDFKQLKYSCMINGVTDLIITKVDILSDMEEIKYYSNDETYKTIKSWRSDQLHDESYMMLPDELKYFLNIVRLELETEIGMISIGPNRNDIIYL